MIRALEAIITAPYYYFMAIKKLGWRKFFAGFRNPKKFRDNLAVVAIAKNEGAYFREWIEYHLAIGIDRFYIYDNESIDDTRTVLQDYIDRGIVVYTYLPGEKKQFAAYTDCIDRIRDNTRWLAAIDIDEFIFGLGKNNILDFLRRAPKKFVQFSFGSLEFGSNGHQRRPDGPVLKNYTRHAVRPYQCKSIANPRRIYNSRSAHKFEVYGVCGDENYKLMRPTKKLMHDFSINKIRINHYKFKSLEESLAKQKRGSAVFGPQFIKFTDEYIARNEKINNEVFDDSANVWAEKL